jgi:hypothetical protein
MEALKMKYVSFKEYEDAKLEVISGAEYSEHSEMNEDGKIHKQYGTKDNGTFYQVTINGVTEFWSDKRSESRYYDGRTREELIEQYEAKLADAEKEKQAEICKAAKSNVRRYPATEYKGRVFQIYKEVKDVYDNQKPDGEIELSEGVYMGGDLYIVPMQVFRTDNPALLKVVFIVSTGGCSMWYSGALESSFAEITGNNIRTALMSLDRKLYYHSGAGDCEGTYDLTPEEWRLEQEA